jgi:hypothetical protein
MFICWKKVFNPSDLFGDEHQHLWNLIQLKQKGATDHQRSQFPDCLCHIALEISHSPLK